jgi:hypothetical protein
VPPSVFVFRHLPSLLIFVGFSTLANWLKDVIGCDCLCLLILVGTELHMLRNFRVVNYAVILHANSLERIFILLELPICGCLSAMHRKLRDNQGYGRSFSVWFRVQKKRFPIRGCLGAMHRKLRNT